MPQQDTTNHLPKLIGDSEIARLVSMSRSWVRKQRYNRRRGLPHELSIDPVLLGTTPRYRLQDVTNWIEQKR